MATKAELLAAAIVIKTEVERFANTELRVGTLLENMINASQPTVVVVTENYNASNQDLILANATAGNVTITLPAVVLGLTATIKKTDVSANQVIISGNIDGDAQKIITTQYDSITVISDGTNWFII